MRQRIPTALALLLTLVAACTQAQVANDTKTQNAILAGLPQGVTAELATTDQIAQAATDLAFGLDGNLEANITQVMVSLGELTRAGRFKNAPRFGDNNPTGRFYIKIMNVGASNLDVSSEAYYGLTVQDMTRMAAAARTGSNFLNGAKNNPITRK